MTRLRWFWILAALAVVAAAAVFVAQQRMQTPGHAATKAARYHCPMHPTYVSDRPGDCPICGMKLVPIEATGGAAAAANAGERTIAFYRSPMDPQVRSDKPAKDAMGMDFVPVYQDELEGASSAVEGRSLVKLSAEKQRVLGVRSEEVKRVRLAQETRTTGLVAVDERLVHHVHTKFEGYVERLYVDYTGKLVQPGERLLSIYSPDLVATQQEYLLAHRAQARLAGSAVASVAQGGADLREAARQRLLFWDITPADIGRLEQTGEVRRTLDLHADHGGYVVQKAAYQGMRVMPTDNLFDIADLSHLWVLADVYQYNLAAVRLGARADVVVSQMSDRKWSGAVTYISPTVEEKTRTIKVRVEVDNADGRLKPDMYADVFLHADLGEGPVVPESAVINAGDRRLVFLDLGDGRYQPREVRLGVKTEQGWQVLSGVREGERVVTAANFLLDSESSLKAALSSMQAAPGASPAGEHRH
jgi:Cu(I)/Ag(I) efflux system membrane fusion protein/cobalt-zinc-cadmium efflux system membrane fusion protein